MDGDVALFVAHVDNPLIVATHHKPIGVARNVPGCDPSAVMSHACAVTMVAMEEVGMDVLENAAHSPSLNIAGDGTNREVRLHDLAEVISGIAVASEVPNRFRSPISSLDLSGDAAFGDSSLPAAHRAPPSWTGIFALEPGHHGQLARWLVWNRGLGSGGKTKRP